MFHFVINDHRLESLHKDAQRQASAGTRDGVKDQPTNLAARAPLHAPVGLPSRPKAQLRHDESGGTEQSDAKSAWRRSHGPGLTRNSEHERNRLTTDRMRTMRAGDQAARNQTTSEPRPNQGKSRSNSYETRPASVERDLGELSESKEQRAKSQEVPGQKYGRECFRERYLECLEQRRQPNVKHQRARATESRVKDELSLRALRCMR